jgi:hypothetical protein
MCVGAQQKAWRDKRKAQEPREERWVGGERERERERERWRRKKKRKTYL